MIATNKVPTVSINEPRLIFQELEVDSSVIEQFVSGLHYPVTKQEVINQARRRWVPENVMAFYVNRLPERLYRTPSDISFSAFASAYFFSQD